MAALGLRLKAWSAVVEGGMPERMLIKAMLAALEVFASISCLPPPPRPPLQTHPLNRQVTMEEEDESRGKTEESGEDRGDGPPDRDPTLSPSAFILVRLLDTWGQGKDGLQVQISGPDSWALGGRRGWEPGLLAPLKGLSLVIGVSGMAVSQEQSL